MDHARTLGGPALVALACSFASVACSYPDYSFDHGPSDGEPQDTSGSGSGDTDIFTHDDSANPLGDSSSDARGDSHPGDGAVDTGTTSTDSAADVFHPDGCVTNACGGCAALVHGIGDACGACGKYACDGANAVKCVDPGTNACGGCATLSNTPGTSCSTCGKWACAGADVVTCSDPGTNACGGCAKLSGTPGGACCGGTLSCAADKNSLVCSGTSNACGGCTVLTNPPGAACGKCNSGAYACTGADSTACNDPVPAADPAPGTTCGTCGTLKYACVGPSNVSTACPGDDTNACGWCGTLAHAPGGPCGKCSDGVWTCNTATHTVTCVGASSCCTC